MDRLTQETLRHLGAGESIDAVCRAAGIDRDHFHERWRRTAESRVPPLSGTRTAAVDRTVEIDRDCYGIPHIFAQSDADLFFGFGYAMAQDRLFQLDWLRRKGAGRLSEILGNDGLPQDMLSRTVGLNRIARGAIERVPDETRELLAAFSSGVNALIEESRENLPIEFDLLDYCPEPWRPVDCLLIEYEFQWYLTGRFPVIAMPELAKRALGDGDLYRAYLRGETDSESILWPGDYRPRVSEDAAGSEPVGAAVGDPDAGIGSNNWVVNGRRSASGKPMVASDPHIAIEAVSCWYPVHLQGGSFDVAGCGYVGMPAVLIGRNRRVAWGITNNICSLRDLYQEKTSPEQPSCYLDDGQWKPARELTELIHVRGFGPVSKRILYSHNGPIVDSLLPAPANQTGPVSLKWLGAHEGGWLTSLLSMNRASDCAGFRAALQPWKSPTFSLVFGDVDGNIGYQTTGRIPVRKHSERGYRRGWDPDDRWQGLIPFESMPSVSNPERGFVVTANNRIAPDDFPYPLSGTWTSGDRAKRIRELIESREVMEGADHRRFQHDARSLRAAACLPALCQILQVDASENVRRIVALFEAWDGEVTSDSIAAAVFNVFFVDWCKRVASERFPEELCPLLAGGIDGLAAELFQIDTADWFAGNNRENAVRETFRRTLDRLAGQLGADLNEWKWGRLHRLELKHVLDSRGELGRLLNRPAFGAEAPGVSGDMTTVCNTGRGPNFEAAAGAGYRMVCDLGETPAGIWAIDCQSQSGHPGSTHYGDQCGGWIEGHYHFIPLDRVRPDSDSVTTLRIEPA